jgi:ATP-dependent DNA ligase
MHDGKVTLWSRRGNLFTSRFPEIARACEKLPPETLIDGEVVAIDESGRVSFNALQHSGKRAHLHFYARCRYRATTEVYYWYGQGPKPTSEST